MDTIYERNINVKIRRIDSEGKIGKEIFVYASLLDLDHSLQVSLRIDISSRRILEAQGRMVKVPFRKCKLAEDRIKNIKGLVVKKGVNKEVAKIVGGSYGCTHMVEVVQTALRFASAIIIGLRVKTGPEAREVLSEEERIAKSFDLLKGSCVAYSEDLEEGKG